MVLVPLATRPHLKSPWQRTLLWLSSLRNLQSFRSSVPEPGQRTNLYFLEITIITEGNNKTYVLMIWLHFTMISALEVIFTSTYTVWWKHYVDNLKSILVRVFTTWKLVNTINWSLFLCWLSRFRKSWLRKC